MNQKTRPQNQVQEEQKLENDGLACRIENGKLPNEKEKDWLADLDCRLLNWLWQPSAFIKGPKGWGFFVLRVVHLSVRNAFKERLPFSANALTFITLLGLVPALAISFALAKGLGFANPLRKLLLENELLFSQKDILEQIIGYVERTQVGTLGVMGLIFLVVTMILIISSVEQVFNNIWEAPNQRSWVRKFTDYFSVMVIFPLLVLAATGAWAALSTHQVVQWLLDMAVVGEVARTGMGLGPFFMLAAAFAFIYLFLPNTRVSFTSALVAGLTTAFFWWTVQSIYIFFQIGVSRYNAIYGGFATLPLFMVWVQVSWTVVLFGGQVAHAHQVCLHGPMPRFVYAPLSPAQRENLGMQIMHRLAMSFHNGFGPVPLNDLARGLGMPLGEVQGLVRTLAENNLLTIVEPNGSLQPARSLETITLGDLRRILRGPVSPHDGPSTSAYSPLPEGLLAKAEELSLRNLDQINLLDLVQTTEGEQIDKGGNNHKQ
ncbi:YhjD/YihY/BrkB family envelope integrity protein [Dethiosulfatarculus sandiegensis]|uniref:Ribonuclease BN n=1 Tax=Dethiosulfatarculus sandiegensis TaxID=1429043 RepID=A0A0D2HLG6_9BACT|nr:YhjD/YihY/BrkB family envelope integrity protein [Dethiosulfatarculus sandiegensis]KIX11443.1 ribonuclease BN [Dethiosulfatarculus sandiegensis]